MTVRPKASETPTNPVPKLFSAPAPGKLAANVTLAQPPSTSQNVSMNSAARLSSLSPLRRHSADPELPCASCSV